MTLLSKLTDSDLERQIAALSRDLAALKKTLGRRGSAYYEDGREAASDLYDDLAERIGHAMPALRKQARVVERSAREHPGTAAAVGVVALGLVAMLLFSRR